jgi:hypothetical protein
MTKAYITTALNQFLVIYFYLYLTKNDNYKKNYILSLINMTGGRCAV